MNHIRPGGFEHFIQIAELLFDSEPLAELFCHQRFAIADRNDFGAFECASDLRSVRISDLAASNDTNP